MIPQTTKARLIKKTFLHEEICEFVFEMETPFSFVPGQFAMIDILDGKELKIKRAYSISSSPSQLSKISFLIKKVEGGRGTSWLFEEFQEGGVTNLLGPLGHMKLKGDEEEVLLIATGIGIPPMLSIVEYFAEQEFPTLVKLIFGTCFESQLCYHDRLKTFAETFENFEYFPCVSRQQSHGEFFEGRANAFLETLNIDFKKQSVFICGSPEVAKDLRALVEQKGALSENIQMEAF